MIFPIGFLPVPGVHDFGNAIFIDGVNDKAVAPHIPAYNFGTGDWCIAFWLNMEVFNANQVFLITKRQDASNYIEFFKAFGGVSRRLAIRVAAGGTAISANTPNPVFDIMERTWIYCAFGVSNNTLMIVQNGQYGSNQISAGGLNLTNTGPLQFGNTGMAEYLDSIMLFNRFPSLDEHKYLHNGGLGNDPMVLPGLGGYWRADEPAGYAFAPSMLVDSSANANHAVLSGYTSGAKDFVRHYSV